MKIPDLSVLFLPDPAGNATSDGTNMYVYDARNRMATVLNGGATIASYVFNGKGERVQKTSSVGTVFGLYDESAHVLGEYSAAAAKEETFYLGDIPIGVIMGSNTYYVSTDYADTPRALRNATNQLVWLWPQNNNDVYGVTLPLEDPSGTGTTTTYNLRFPGQIYDAETGLHYNYMRDYNPSLGRYMQPDPFGLSGGINRYVYVGGNPVSLTDVTGLTPDWFNPSGVGNNSACVAACTATGAVVGGVVGTIGGGVVGGVVGGAAGGTAGSVVPVAGSIAGGAAGAAAGAATGATWGGNVGAVVGAAAGYAYGRSTCSTLSDDNEKPAPDDKEKRRQYCSDLYDSIVKDCQAERNATKKQQCYAAAAISRAQCLKGQE